MKNLFLTLIYILFLIRLQAQSVDSSKHTISTTYELYHFDKQFTSNWQIAAVEYKRKTAAGDVIGRINYADRLNRQGWQFEVESYPVVSKRVYAYTGLGISANSPVFPEFRSGASLYVTLPKGWEAEGGFRHLKFSENLWIGTAGFSKYYRAWLFNIRSFISLHDLKNNRSLFFMARRYFKNEIDYSWVQVGSGVSPDERRNVQLTGNSNLSSKRIIIGSRFSLTRKNQLVLSAGWSRDEYLPNTYGNQININSGFNFRF